MEVKCFECTTNSIYICDSCPTIEEFCYNHVSEHLQKTRDHTILFINSNFYKVNFASKSAILQKLKQILQTTETLRDNYLQKSLYQIEQLKKTIKLTLADFDDILQICFEHIKEVTTRKYIKIQKHISHLDYALCSVDANFLLSQITTPSLSQIENMIEFIPSNFMYVFNNYKTISLCHKPDGSTLMTTPQTIVFKDQDFKQSSRSLQISYSEIMFTGGSGASSHTAKIYNAYTRASECLASLNIGRRFHAMTFIDGFPAVLGGSVEETITGNLAYKQLKSVEIFKDNVWQCLPDMNLERSCISAVYTGKITWAIGGFDNSTLNSIEKFEKGAWSLLKVTLPFSVRSSLTYALGNNILIIGGKISGGEDSSEVLYFNPNSQKITKVRSLQIQNNFPENCFYLENGGTIQALGEGEKLTRYEFAPN